MRVLKPYLIILQLLIVCKVSAQLYPIQATSQLIPPYSVYLSDYAAPGAEKLRVILIQRDLTQPSYLLRLVMTVELNGSVILRTSKTFNPAPLTLSPGVPTIISGPDLAPYVDSRNIDFIGYSREQYERTRALPEGSYQITFTAYDYHRQDVQVSNAGTSFYFLSKNEPPLINTPACGTQIPNRTPQQIVFTWLPRNTASPNSAAETHYEFSLYETRPDGRNPNDVVLSTTPVFKTTVDFPQLVYGPAEPLLLENMKYVWRVRAIDINGKDAFRNNGYSEVCTFTYGGVDPNLNIGVVKGLQAETQTERRARIWWTTGDFDSYRVNYRKKGNNSYEWFYSDITKEQLNGASTGELKLFDLEPNTPYEARLQGRKSGVLGNYSDVVAFTTLPSRAVACGEGAAVASTPGKPNMAVIKGMIINADGLEVILAEVINLGNGFYQGTGRVSMPYLGGASFAVKFNRIYINEERNVEQGRIDFVTKGVAAMVEEQLASQQKRKDDKKQQENRDAWADTDFYEKVFVYDNIDIDKIAVQGSSVVNVTDVNSNITANAEVMQVINTVPNKAIIIQDKSGDQFVVQKNETTGEVKVTKVEGGGLSPTMNVEVTDESLTIIRKALRALRTTEFTDDKISNLKSDADVKKYSLSEYINKENSMIVANAETPVSNPIYSELMEIDMGTDESVSDFKSKSMTYKLAEYALNRAIVIRIFADENRSKDEIAIISKSLLVNNLSISEYVAAQKSAGKDETAVINDVKMSIMALVDKILTENVYNVK